MKFKRKGIRFVEDGFSRNPSESLDSYISAFTFGSGETVQVGRSDTLNTTITRGTRRTDGDGKTLQLQGGTALGANKSGGSLNMFLGYSTGNAHPGNFNIYGGGTGSGGSNTNALNTLIFSVNGGSGTGEGDIYFIGDRLGNNGSNNALNIVTDSNMIFSIDRDADEGSNYFSFTKNATGPGAPYGTEIAKIDESGNLQIDGSLTVGSTEVINSSAQFSASAIPTLDSNKVKQIVTTHHCFTISAGGSAQDFWVPFIGTSEQATPNNTHRTVAPYDGLIKRIVVHATGAFDSSAQVRYHKINGGDTDDFANDNSTDDTTTNVTVDLSTAYTAATADFSSGNTFSAGDQIGIGLVRNNSTTGDVAMTVVWEYTIS